MSNELTDVRCPCGAEFQADSYDAGFIAGSGMCQNCNAALPPKDICTCPSGDGSLRHPCPAHPASVELAGVAANLTFINGRPAMCGCQVEYSSGGGEYSDVIYVTLCAKHSGSAILDLVATNRIALTPEYEGQWHADLYLDREVPLAKAEGKTPSEAVLAVLAVERTEPEQAEGAQEIPSPVSQEYDRHLISLLRKGEALPGHQEEAADEIERLRDWNDHLNNTVLPNILNPNFLMLMKGGERLLDLCTKDGKFIGVSLNDMKDVFDWMVTHARIAPDHAALAQPSPAQAEQAEAELEKQEPVGEVRESGGTLTAVIVRHSYATKLPVGTKLYAAPVAQAQQLHDLDKQCRDDVARALGLRPSQERGFAWSYLLASIKSCVKASEDAAQSQHSVPEGYALIPVRETEAMHDAVMALLYKGVARTDTQKLLDAYIAAAPGKEGV
ncbi:hypothetical protein [Pseudomonas aeruginosa]|uniref:hypothetical protein n=1 Tax=Pseudomonas aeruginosa TaxID=287 RepID=UPI00191136B9|nr:hypothetical protein [Pseudomonas aeruginosa]